MEEGHDGMNLHEACYQGRLDVAARLLANGADPNEPADPIPREWISCAGNRPRPLNCVAIAWTMTENHVQIAKLLIGHGAVVDDSVLRDHTIEMEGGAADLALRNVLETAWSAATGTVWSWSENK
jgi:ankyrin repeat protein